MNACTRAALRVAAIIGISAAAPSAFAQQCEQQSVTGHVEFIGSQPANSGNRVQYQFSAVRQNQVDEEGNCRVRGEVEERVHLPSGDLFRHSHGTVVCFTIEANPSGGYTARIGAKIDRTSNVPPAGITHGILTVEDNGEGANDPPDRGSAINGRTEPGAFLHCATHSDPPMGTVIHGNVQIRR